jgi:DNA invertase Pin-like site-specific DNA recombinase
MMFWLLESWMAAAVMPWMSGVPSMCWRRSAFRVHCLALGGVDLTNSAGRMTMQVIAAVAEFERNLLIERTQAGLSRARSTGKTFGRPESLNEE